MLACMHTYMHHGTHPPVFQFTVSGPFRMYAAYSVAVGRFRQGRVERGEGGARGGGGRSKQMPEQMTPSRRVGSPQTYLLTVLWLS